MNCASTTYCHTLIKPTQCPFCLASWHKKPSERFRAWDRDVDVIRHIEAEHGGEVCGLCGMNPVHFAMQFHLSNEHGFRRSQVKPKGIDPPTSIQPDDIFDMCNSLTSIKPDDTLDVYGNSSAKFEGTEKTYSEAVDKFMLTCFSFPSSPAETIIGPSGDDDLGLTEQWTAKDACSSSSDIEMLEKGYSTCISPSALTMDELYSQGDGTIRPVHSNEAAPNFNIDPDCIIVKIDQMEGISKETESSPGNIDRPRAKRRVMQKKTKQRVTSKRRVANGP
ncbi:hypothetical protein BX600DRAFT_70188 [Xylariales sp. PMI_506]|nr:hypothetical protein BX600DRAFT_70188 [Xylariales sp. PMI_506]